MPDRGIQPGWYWSPGWSRAHYVVKGQTRCRHVARHVVEPIDIPHCAVCTRSVKAVADA